MEEKASLNTCQSVVRKKHFYIHELVYMLYYKAMVTGFLF